MKQKKIIIIMSYDHEEKLTKSNSMIEWNIERELRRTLDPYHERIESVTVEDTDMKLVFDNEATMKDLELIRDALYEEIHECETFMPMDPLLPKYKKVLDKIEDLILKY